MELGDYGECLFTTGEGVGQELSLPHFDMAVCCGNDIEERDVRICAAVRLTTGVRIV